MSDAEEPYRLARHLVSLHFETPPERVKGALSPETLTDYISYGKGERSLFFLLFASMLPELHRVGID